MFALNRATRAVQTKSARFFAANNQDKNYPVAAAQELFAAAKKAGGDLYAPISVADKWVVASRNIPNFTSLLTHPMVTVDRRANFIADFAKHINADVATTALIQKIAVDGRWDTLNEIFATYKKTVAAERKETIAVVTSAATLTKEEVASVTKSLEKHLQKGYKLVVEQVVNPHILGGLSISMGNMYQDLTLATAITGYEEQLDKAIL